MGMIEPQGILGGAGGQAIAQTLGQLAQQNREQEIEMNPVNLLMKYGPQFMNQYGAMKLNVQQAKQVAQTMDARRRQQEMQQNILNDPNSPDNLKTRVQYNQMGIEGADKDIDLKTQSENYKKFNKALELARTSKTPIADIMSNSEALEGVYRASGSNPQTFMTFLGGMQTLHDEVSKEKYAETIAGIQQNINQEMVQNKVMEKLAGDPTQLLQIKMQYLDKYVNTIATEDPDLAMTIKKLGPAIFDENMTKIIGTMDKIADFRTKNLAPDIQLAGVDATLEAAGAKVREDRRQFGVTSAQKDQELLLSERKLGQKTEGQGTFTFTFNERVGTDANGNTVFNTRKYDVPLDLYRDLRRQFFEAFGKVPEELTEEDKQNPILNRAQRKYYLNLGVPMQ